MINLTSRQMAILGELQVNSMNGYSIRKKLMEVDTKISFGSLYPALRKLESLGLIKHKWEGDKDSEKKIYEITAKGIQEYQHNLEYMTPHLNLIF